MKSRITFFQNQHVVVVVLLVAVLSLMVLASVSAKAQGQPDPKSGKGKTTRPVLKKRDPEHKQAKPADPDTCAYFVLTAAFDQQVQAIASDYIFQDLRKIYGDNIVIASSLQEVPVNVEKSRIHTVNLKLIQNRLENVPTDSLPKAVARAVLDPLGNIAAGKVEQASKVPGTGDVARIILKQGKRSTNVDGQDIALRYWWTLNVKVDGLAAKDETFIWIVARHRTDDYKNQYCYNAVGLGSNFTNIEPYDTEDWLGCDDPAIVPGLYNLTIKELWQRPVVKQWLATIPKPPAPRTVGQVVAEHEANENCDMQEYDSALKRYKCVKPKVQTPCLQRRPNTDGTFTCLDVSSSSEGNAGQITSHGILGGKAGGSGGRVRPTDTQTETATTPKPKGFQFRKTLWYDKTNPMADLEVDMLIPFLGELGYYANAAESRPDCRAFDAAMELALGKFQRKFSLNPPSGYPGPGVEVTGRLDEPTRAALNFMSSQGLYKFVAPYTGGKICEGLALLSTPKPQPLPAAVDTPPHLGHTGRVAFQEIFFDPNSGMEQMSGPNVEKVLAFLVNNENLAWNPAWRGISFGRNSAAAWREVEDALKAAGLKGVIQDGRVNKAEWDWLNTQDPNLFKLTSAMLQSKAKAAAVPATVKK